MLAWLHIFFMYDVAGKVDARSEVKWNIWTAAGVLSGYVTYAQCAVLLVCVGIFF